MIDLGPHRSSTEPCRRCAERDAVDRVKAALEHSPEPEFPDLNFWRLVFAVLCMLQVTLLAISPFKPANELAAIGLAALWSLLLIAQILVGVLRLSQ